MIDVAAVQEPYLLSVPPVVDCALAVVALSNDAGDSLRAQVEECPLIMLCVFLDQVHCPTEDVLEVAFNTDLVLKCLLELLVLHNVAHFLQELNDLPQVNILTHALHEVLVAGDEELFEVFLFLCFLLFTL